MVKLTKGNVLATNLMGNIDNNIGEDGNFFITYDLNAGETYYIRTYAGFISNNDYPVSFDVLIDFAEHTVSYNGNGGIISVTEQKKKYAEDLILSQGQPVREGYDFIGWSTDPNALSADYLQGERYTQDEDVTLYAIWEKIALKSPQISVFEKPDNITISWIDVSDADNYEVYQLTDDGPVQISVTTETKFVVSNPLGGNYSFYVTASNSDGASDMSNVETVDYKSLTGDINGDGYVDNLDLLNLKEYLSDVNSTNDPNYDINADGYVDNLDLLELKAILSS